MAKLQDEIAFLKRHIFGKKSERFISKPDGEQLLFDEFKVEVPVSISAPKEQELPQLKEKIKPVRKPIDESKFEQVIQEILPDGDISEMKYIGVEFSKYYELVDAKIVVRKIKRFKYQKPDGEFITADLPYRPFAKSAVSSSIVSEVTVQKYVDALPINRLQQAWRRLGIEFPYSSLLDMPKMGYDLIMPLFEAFKKSIMNQSYLQVDESPIKVLCKEKKKTSHIGFYYVAHDPVNQCVLYDYNKHKNYKQTGSFLDGFNGKVLQSDGYEGYDAFIKSKPDIVHLYCMAHARRYFEKALDNDPQRAKHFLEKVQQLYQTERIIKEQNIIGDEKVRYRKEHASPILTDLGRWLHDQRSQVAPKSSIGKAIAYSIERWNGLSAYCDYDFAQIDNNPVERSIRPMVIGRKNYLFAGSHESAQRAACFYSFFITCRYHGVNPKSWIEDVFEKIEHMKPSQYHTLFPQNWGK